MPKLEVKPLTFFRPDPKQVRKTFHEADLRLLGESLRKKQLQPILCQPDGTIIAGERRYRAAVLVGLTTLEAKIADEVLNDAQVRIWQLTENLHRADLSGYEKWMACAELMCMNPAWQMKDLAEHLNLDPSMVTRLLSPSKCIVAVQEALAANKLTVRDCYAISQLPAEDQQGLLNLRLAPGGKLADVEQAGRKKRNARPASDRPEPKVAKGKFPLSKAVVQITGNDLTISAIIDVLTSLLKEAKAGQAQGMDIPALMALLVARTKDKAKKG